MTAFTQKRSYGHLMAFLAVLCFALNIPATSYILGNELDPLSYTFMRVAGGFIVCWVCSIFTKQQKVEKKKDYLLFLPWGIIGLGIFFYFYADGIGRTSPINASIILSMTPVIVLIISAIVLKEKITRYKGLGVLLSMGGALWVILTMGKSGHESGMLGNIFVLIATAIYALYLVFTRELSRRYNPMILLRWFFLFAFLAFLPFGIKPFIHSQLIQNPSLMPIMVSAFIAIFPTAVGYILLPISFRLLIRSADGR